MCFKESWMRFTPLGGESAQKAAENGDFFWAGTVYLIFWWNTKDTFQTECAEECRKPWRIWLFDGAVSKIVSLISLKKKNFVSKFKNLLFVMKKKKYFLAI